MQNMLLLNSSFFALQAAIVPNELYTNVQQAALLYIAQYVVFLLKKQMPNN